MSAVETAIDPSAAGAPRAPGRTTVAPRALHRVISAVTGDAFGVAPKAVRVDLSDLNGMLAVRVRTPVRVRSLQRLRDGTRNAADGESLLRRASDAHAIITERVTELTGIAIAHVTVELTGTDVREDRGVR